MNRTILTIAILLGIVSLNFADETAVSQDGRSVLLRDDGTWEYVTEGPGDESKWETVVDIDPLTDERVISFGLASDEGRNSWGKEIFAVVRISPKKVDFYLHWQTYIGSTDLGSDLSVTTRIGSDQAVKKEWAISTDHEISIYPENSTEFVRSLLGQTRLVAKVTPYGDKPIVAIFDISGLGEALEAAGVSL